MSFPIDRIMIGDGKKKESGLTMEYGKLYAATGLSGGDESFWPIDIKSLSLSVYTLGALLRAMEDSKNEMPHKKKVLRDMFDRVVEWLMSHRGVPIVVGGVGARGRISNARKFEVHQFGPNLARNNEDHCVAAAISNGTASLYGDSEGLRVRHRLFSQPVKIKTLKQLFTLVHQLDVPLTMRRVPKNERRSFEDDPFKWLARRKSGVWIVRVTEHGVVDHCIAIDGNRGVVHDSASRYPFALTEDVLRLLGGDEAQRLQVAEVRELVKVASNPKKRSGSKRGRDE